MEYTILGRTGLRVSVAGLGAGGHSRLGMSQGQTPQEAESLVRAALDHGINFLDTAEAYGTEEVLGRAIHGQPRESVVICTKKGVRGRDGLHTADEMQRGVEASLRRLNADYVDVFYLHGLNVADYDYAVAEIYPALDAMREAGKIRFIGVTEAFAPDPGHATLQRAMQDDIWDVIMVGFNILNQSARETVFPAARRHGTGTVDMFAVRRALSRPEVLREVLSSLAARGEIEISEEELKSPLDFLLHEGGAESLTDAAYRFCRHEPGLDVVLFGTGSRAHLEENIASLLRPPLPEECVERLKTLFRGVDSVSGN